MRVINNFNVILYNCTVLYIRVILVLYVIESVLFLLVYSSNIFEWSMIFLTLLFSTFLSYTDNISSSLYLTISVTNKRKSVYHNIIHVYRRRCILNACLTFYAQIKQHKSNYLYKFHMHYVLIFLIYLFTKLVCCM